MKKVYVFISFILVSILFNSFLYSPNLINVATGEKITNFTLQWPLLRLFIEPFYAFAYYILTLERSGYIFALSSWLFWIVAFVIVFSKYKKVKTKNIVIYCLSSFFFLISLIAGIIVLPVIGPKLAAPDNYKVFDIHSHTIASRDNISNVMSSINFHKEHGFTEFFITEHDNVDGFYSIPADVGTDNIFPGIQIRTTEGISVLILSRYQFKYAEFKDKSIREIAELAHEKGMLVVVPHWWKWNRPDMQDLVDMGVDGFEIYNCGYRYITRSKREQLIDICKKNNLMMFGTTDWHGLGYMTNVWTVTQKSGNEDLFDLLKAKPNNTIIEHNMKGNQSVARYIFEPFYAFYLYITKTELKYILSFYMIISVVALLFIKFPPVRIIRIGSLLISLFFSLTLVYFSFVLSFHMLTNVFIPETIFPVAISLSLIHLIIWSVCDKNI